jgi:hypothetical protein
MEKNLRFKFSRGKSLLFSVEINAGVKTDCSGFIISDAWSRHILEPKTKLPKI